jgi:hypothetical protein
VVLGIAIQPIHLIISGLTLLTLLVLQLLIGLRVIRFKGRLHLRVHKGLAWTLVALASFHGLFAITFLRAWRIF